MVVNRTTLVSQFVVWYSSKMKVFLIILRFIMILKIHGFMFCDKYCVLIYNILMIIFSTWKLLSMTIHLHLANFRKMNNRNQHKFTIIPASIEAFCSPVICVKILNQFQVVSHVIIHNLISLHFMNTNSITTIKKYTHFTKELRDAFTHHCHTQVAVSKESQCCGILVWCNLD